VSLFLKAGDKGCVQERVTALVTAAKGGAGLGGGRFGAAGAVSLVFGKMVFCLEVWGGNRGGRETPPAATLGRSSLGLGLAQEPKGQRLQPAPGVNRVEMCPKRYGGFTSLQHSASFRLTIFAFNLKLLYCCYTKYIIYVTYIKASQVCRIYDIY